MLYSYPLVIVGFGGMINEMLSRLVYQQVLHLDKQTEQYELGVFGANYRLAVLITIFIQIFRLAAEPFFFNQSKNEGAQKTYARVMKFFVIACCLMFLGISLFLEAWKYLIAYRFPEYAEGIHIVPILSMASVFLGIYYNLSVWYKLTNRNMTGAYITIAGAVITIVLNIVLIPWLHYTGAALATFICYAFMMVTNYILGQNTIRCPMPAKTAHVYRPLRPTLRPPRTHHVAHTHRLQLLPTGILCYCSYLVRLFTWLVLKVEKREFVKLPYIGKYVEKLV